MSLNPAPARSGAGFFVAGFDRLVGFGPPIHLSFRIAAPPDRARQKDRGGQTVIVLKKLQNPFALVVQGFLVGGLLFWTTQGEATLRPAVHATAIIAPN